MTVHSPEMLLKIIQAWPHFISARTIVSKTLVNHLGPAGRFLLVDAFLVSGQVIHSAKAFLATAVGLIAFEKFPVSRFMFSVPIS